MLFHPCGVVTRISAGVTESRSLTIDWSMPMRHMPIRSKDNRRPSLHSTGSTGLGQTWWTQMICLKARDVEWAISGNYQPPFQENSGKGECNGLPSRTVPYHVWENHVHRDYLFYQFPWFWLSFIPSWYPVIPPVHWLYRLLLIYLFVLSPIYYRI